MSGIFNYQVPGRMPVVAEYIIINPQPNSDPVASVFNILGGIENIANMVGSFIQSIGNPIGNQSIVTLATFESPSYNWPQNAGATQQNTLATFEAPNFVWPPNWPR
ncbi:hypothetical protein [Thiolinea disciformis]|uniref:hypothetical protein n=1 Tax=Thiolinea disciformis TaxID=125614 RepID=UPI00037362E2|nr:hypothetical protein [Thiolinea disciformis]